MWAITLDHPAIILVILQEKKKHSVDWKIWVNRPNLETERLFLLQKRSVDWTILVSQEAATPQQQRDGICMPTSSQSTRVSIDLLVRNQVISDTRIKNLDKKIDKKFDKIKSLFEIL